MVYLCIFTQTWLTFMVNLGKYTIYTIDSINPSGKFRVFKAALGLMAPRPPFWHLP